MSTLAELARITGGTLLPDIHAGEVEVSTCTLNSAEATADSLFCAVPGTRAHGAKYAAQAGARAVLTDAEGAGIVAAADPSLPVLVVDDVRRHMGDAAAEIYGHPASKLMVVGITGTSGKTTTSYLIENALMQNHSVGIIGTTGTRINGQPVKTELTTPEAPTMQALLARMVDEGVTHVVMEVSSHALALGRVRGIGFDVAAFTNLSQDHLDFHPTMEDYFQTKASLFSPAYGSPIPVVCADDEWGQRLVEQLLDNNSAGAQGIDAGTQDVAALTCVVTTEADAAERAAGWRARHWNADSVQVQPSGEQIIHVTRNGAGPLAEEDAEQTEDFGYQIALAGNFNVANSLLALACVYSLGDSSASSVEEIARSIGTVQVPGRMQAVNEGQPFLAMVDYAHKPGAVASVVQTLVDYMPSAEGRIGMVLGAGGNRDHDKRPKMGYEAARVADAVFVTDDNPRDEEPAAIRAQVLEGARVASKEREEKQDKVTIQEIADRAEAIAAAVRWAEPGDAIVIAGKGHEKGQLVAGVMHDFDDVAVLSAALREVLAESDRS